MTVPGTVERIVDRETDDQEAANADFIHVVDADLKRQAVGHHLLMRRSPVSVVARRMLSAAIGSTQMHRRMGERVIVVVQVPSTEWMTPVADALRILCRSAETPVDCDHSAARFPSGTYAAFYRDGSQKSDHPGSGNDAVAEAVWSEAAAVGFAVSPGAHLPRDLVHAADIRLTVLLPDGKVLGAAIAEICDRATRLCIPDETVPKLSPNILKLAWRHGQSQKSYLARLVTLAHQPAQVGRPGPSLAELHGMNDAVSWGLKFARDLVEYTACRIPWHDLSVGLLLHGAPGTGKTLFAEALARTTGLPLIATSFAEWQASGSGHLGDCLKAMQASFATARQMAPCIMLIDEMDAFPDRKNLLPEDRDYWTGVITGLLEQMDGVRGRDGVLLIGTTNDHTGIDKAILRSGRMDRLIEVTLPDRNALALILRQHLKGDLDGCDLTTAAGLAVGGSGADCARWARDARQVARHEGRPVQIEDLLHAIGGNAVDADLQMRIAIHEAGHAVASCILRPGALVRAGIGNGGEIGACAVVRAPVRNTRTAIHSELLELMAGRAAEEILLGDVSGGCGGSVTSDLAYATCLAAALETALGLGSAGPVFLGVPNPENIGLMLLHRPGLAAKVATHLEAVYREAVDLMAVHRNAVGAVAQSLVSVRALTGLEVQQLVMDHPALEYPA